MSGLRTALKLARRDAWRHKVNSVLVLVMIALPVAGVSAAAVLYATQDISGTERIETRLGTADALVTTHAGQGEVFQPFDPDDGWGSMGEGGTVGARDAADVLAALGDGRPRLELSEHHVRFETDKGLGDAELTSVDVRDPLADGLFRLAEGRMPNAPGEVAVNAELVDRGPGLGEGLVVSPFDEQGNAEETVTLRIVGVVEHGRYRTHPRGVVLPGALPAAEDTYGRTWLVGGGAVAWDEVRELNRMGAVVTSRSVLADPPPESELAWEVRTGQSVLEGPVITVVALVVVMVLLEVVLLAGPAFAVGARRQSRTLALIAATGGTPRQARQVVLASGVVYGVVAGVLGVVLGTVLAWASVPFAQRLVGSWFGPFELPGGQLAIVAAFGLVSALLAAVVPAWIASRQDVVAVLAGRRGDRRVSLRSPVLGVAVFGIGVLAAALGANRVWQAEILIAASALICVVGMLLCVPLVVVGVARVAARLPLPLRFAARDAARHRTRTVPAVAAVAATVAGVVALGIATASDEAQSRETYTASLPEGMGRISSWGVDAPDWSQLERVVAAEAPGVETTPVLGVPEGRGTGGYVEIVAEVDGEETWLMSGWGSGLGTGYLVGGEVPDVVTGLSDADRARADGVLRQGGVVVFADEPGRTGELALLSRHWQDGMDEQPPGERHDVPVDLIGFDGASAPAAMILSPAAAEQVGVPVETVSLLLTGELDVDTEENLREAVMTTPDMDLYVERGYQAPDEVVILQLILGALGGVLMLGGTLTATFLALSDARPDLATLAAVGSSPRTRRFVGASYALGVGLVGAVLGALVGLVPGIAVTYPLTSVDWMPPGWQGPRHFLDIPWALIGVVVLGLPLFTALVVGLFTRSRLPMVARLE